MVNYYTIKPHLYYRFVTMSRDPVNQDVERNCDTHERPEAVVVKERAEAALAASVMGHDLMPDHH